MRYLPHDQVKEEGGGPDPSRADKRTQSILVWGGGVLSPKGEKSSGLLLLDKREQRKGYKRGQSFVGPETASPISGCPLGLRIQAGRTEGRPNQAVGRRAERKSTVLLLTHLAGPRKLPGC